MASVAKNWSPSVTPTSFSLIRPYEEGESEREAPTGQQSIVALEQAPETPLDDASRFRQIRVFAAGGQGIIYVARDKQLGREVALKELKPRNAERPLSRSRFLREAEITGSLEHPGVVPVYALGQQPDGRPFYAMRLIQGRTLHEAVHQFYNPELDVTPVERNLLFRQLLQRFVSVCQTVAYAHSRGIVHRDLKPANILLGAYGEALVADWGLARPFHPTAGCVGEPEYNLEQHDSIDTPSDSTQMGSALGTPAFMSPEQANGQWDRVGPASDVYGLGATLYVILTGQTPLPKLPWFDAHRRIVSGDIANPRQINPKLARALAAICRKAMAVDPKERYKTPLTLAQDIEHFLADEPVSAEPEPWSDWARRWMQRHKVAVSAMAVFGVATMIGLGILTVWSDKQRRRDQVNSRATREALDLTMHKMVNRWLESSHELTDEDREFLRAPLAAYLRLTGETGTDPETRLAVVRAYRRVGEIRLQLGELIEAKEALAEAETRGQYLGEDKDSCHEWALVRAAQGYLALKRGSKDDVQNAVRYFGEALVVLEDRSFADRDEPQARHELAAAYNNKAAALMAANQKEEAINAFRAAVRLREKSVSPDSMQSTLELTAAYASLANGLISVKKYDEAEVSLRLCVKEAEKLVAKNPRAREPREQLAEAAQKLGTIDCDRRKHATTPKPDKLSAEQLKQRESLRQKQQADSRHWLQVSAEQYEQLSNSFPSHQNYAVCWAETLANIYCLDWLPDSIAGKKSDPIRSEKLLAQFDRALAGLQYAMRETRSERCNKALNQMHWGRYNLLNEMQRYKEAAAECLEIAKIDTARRGDALSRRAMALVKAGQFGDGLAQIEELIAGKEAKPIAMYNAACVYTELAAKGDTERRLSRAVELLVEAKRRDYFQDIRRIQELDGDTDLDALRSRPDFQQFRATLPKSK